MSRSESGMALVLTLLVLTLVVAMVVEFSYGVYTSTSLLSTWKDAQRLSGVAKSCVTLAVAALSDPLARSNYRTVGKVTIPVQDIVEGFAGTAIVTTEDEIAKFNLNSLRYPIGQLNREAYLALRRLLKTLEIPEQIADRLANWLLKDSPFPREQDEPYKDAYLDSVDELLLIGAVDLPTYERLLPYVTVFGPPGMLLVNANTATVPVIMCLAEEISAAAAEGVVARRAFRPFTNSAEIRQVPGLQSVVFRHGQFVVTSSLYRIAAAVEDHKVRRTIECVVELAGSTAIVRQWIET